MSLVPHLTELINAEFALLAELAVAKTITEATAIVIAREILVVADKDERRMTAQHRDGRFGHCYHCGHREAGHADYLRKRREDIALAIINEIHASDDRECLFEISDNWKAYGYLAMHRHMSAILRMLELIKVRRNINALEPRVLGDEKEYAVLVRCLCTYIKWLAR